MNDVRTRKPHLLTVGQVAEQYGVTVRTLHHYDQLGLLSPSERSPSGYRLYTPADLTRLQHVVVYRRLGFPLEQIRALLEAAETPGREGVVEHLRRQRTAVMSRLDELRGLVTAIDQALEKETMGMDLTKEEQQALFGEGFSEELATEAEQRWGDTAAWKESKRRTAKYTKQDWAEIKAETDAIHADFVAALGAGLAATSERAMDVAERARQQISRRFYTVSPAFHRNLAELYVADPRFTKTYEDLAPGLAQYVRDAIHANADRQERGAR